MSDYALVTGAGKGIGRSIALQLAGRGYDLLLTGRDYEGLQETEEMIRTKYSRKAHVFVADLTEESAPAKLWHWSAPFHDRLSIVVNNAGYGLNAPFADLPLQRHLDLIRVNINAVVSISHLFIPVLKRREKSWLLNVASTTAYQGLPYFNTYAASKAFVLSFTRALHEELRLTSVSVTALTPGSTDTDFVNRAQMSQKTKKLAQRSNMTPGRVAELAIDGLFRGKAEVVPGASNKLHAIAARLLPKFILEKAAARIYGPGKKDAARSIQKFSLEEEDFTAA